jgi:hypothetical protein
VAPVQHGKVPAATKQPLLAVDDTQNVPNVMVNGVLFSPDYVQSILAGNIQQQESQSFVVDEQTQSAHPTSISPTTNTFSKWATTFVVGAAVTALAVHKHRTSGCIVQ